MINIANAKLYGELTEEHSNLLKKFQKLKSSQITLNNKDLFLTELLEKVKKHFKSVGFVINEAGDKDFEAALPTWCI